MAVWDSDAAKRQKKILNRFDPPALDDDDDFWPRRPRRDPFRKDRYVAITLSIAVLLIGGVVWYFAPLRPKAVKTMPSARGNLWLIGYAIQLYHKENGQLPPAFIRDESGKPAHSWRVIILPYLARVDHDEEAKLKALYQDYKFSEPWDGPNNKNLIDRMPQVYSLPHMQEVQNKTRFHAVIGDESAWPIHGVRTWNDFVDGLPETVLLVQDDELPTTWTAPIDPTMEKWKYFSDPKPKRDDLRATRQYTVLFADRSIGGLSNLHEIEYRKAFFTVAGREFIDVEFSKPGGQVKLPPEAADDYVTPDVAPEKAPEAKPNKNANKSAASDATSKPLGAKGKLFEPSKKGNEPGKTSSPADKSVPNKSK